MKLSSILSTVGLLYLTVVNAAEVSVSVSAEASTDTDTKTFSAPKDKDGKQKIKTGAKFGKSGAKIDLCPSGDCINGQVITLAMSRLQEFDATGTSVAKADNFNKGTNAWTPVETIMINGVSASVTTFAGDIDVGSSTAKFNLTTVIFESTSWAMNGAQNLTIPAGALKFSIAIQNWPFATGTTDHYLKFAVTLKAKSKNSTTTLGAPKQTKGNATFARDTVDMGEGMYMDAPTKAVIDDMDTDISAAVEISGNLVEYVWRFPQFTELYYDPVVGSTDADATPADATAPSPSGASMAMVASSLVAGVAALSLALF
ncbi:hypothetical protein Poli38472_003630 [Pythium oligandrum]|uniref:Uncharacterized protein n=1 Tax=Pythium oligandrum TaxID=41045 RepID=A0A8K1FJA4_PYTOL|nr:hypothetical protein Poli38472_003630 [Pythium oligandrum]|eukprot:TMW65865.1 hypothetical protein Poli38472_003630 [Pythium oligandrum]